MKTLIEHKSANREIIKPEYNLDCWVVVGEPDEQRLIGFSNRYDGESDKNIVRTSRILGRRGYAIETKNSIYNLLECSISESKDDMLKDIKEFN